MGLNSASVLLLSLLVAPTLGASISNNTRGHWLPTVNLDSATVLGTTDGTVTQFLGVPYAQPPYARTLLLSSGHLAEPLPQSS